MYDVSGDKVGWYRLPVPDDGPKPPRAGPNTRRLSEVVGQEVEWLWPQRSPVGYLLLVSGDLGLGKTWLILDLFARATIGRGFPDSPPNPFARADGMRMGVAWPRRDVLWISAEDADEDVILPQFRLLGGDPTRHHSLSHVLAREHVRGRVGYANRERALDLSAHLEHLGNWLAAHPLVVAVGLDPLAAFLGRTDTHRNSDVRGLLTPLARLVDRHRVAVVANNHLNKGDGDNALYRGMGSVAFVAAARSSWLVSRDQRAKDRRLVTPVKNNLAGEEAGGAGVPGRPGRRRVLLGGGVVATTADEALRGPVPYRDTRAPARAGANEWLRELLGEGSMPAREVWERAAADGLCKKTVQAAKQELGVRSEKAGGPESPWVWTLPRR